MVALLERVEESSRAFENTQLQHADQRIRMEDERERLRMNLAHQSAEANRQHITRILTLVLGAALVVFLGALGYAAFTKDTTLIIALATHGATAVGGWRAGRAVMRNNTPPT